MFRSDWCEMRVRGGINAISIIEHGKKNNRMVKIILR